MAGNDRVRVEGVREVQTALKRLEVSSRDLSGAHRQVVSGLLPGIAIRTPRRTGRLASSWGAGATKTRGKITSSAPYAGVIEYGWSAHSIEPARMVRDTIEGAQRDIVKGYERELERLGRSANFDVRKAHL